MSPNLAQPKRVCFLLCAHSKPHDTSLYRCATYSDGLHGSLTRRLAQEPLLVEGHIRLVDLLPEDLKEKAQERFEERQEERRDEAEKDASSVASTATAQAPPPRSDPPPSPRPPSPPAPPVACVPGGCGEHGAHRFQSLSEQVVDSHWDSSGNALHHTPPQGRATSSLGSVIASSATSADPARRSHVRCRPRSEVSLSVALKR